MSLRTVMMSNSRSSSPRHPGFFRRLIGCVLFVVGIAGFMALINVYQVNLSQLLMTIFAVLAIGLAAGAAPRASFYGWSVWIRFLAMLIVLLLGLVALGFFTNWRMGIGPLDPWLNGVVDPNQLTQFGGAFFVATVALWAWGQPAEKAERVHSNHRHSLGRRGSGEIPVDKKPAGHPESLHTHVTRSTNPSPRISSFLRFMKVPKPRRQTKPGNGKLILSRTAQPTRSGFGRIFRRKPNVQVSLYEEHRCPYCLEVVTHNDPRGVKKCNVCSTMHHADCWEITGTCQVPHLNN
jgi:hypothetical protein